MAKKQEFKRVLMSDIAREAGVSTNTVSNALNGSSLVKEETKARILEIAERMNYIGNASARYLRSGKSNMIAVIVGDIANPHLSLAVKQLCDQFAQKNYGTLVLNTNEDAAIERRAIETALRQNVDGIILSPTADSEDNVRFLNGFNIPFVLLGRKFDSVDCNYVISDDEYSGYIIGKHLLERGHNKILFMNGPENLSCSIDRLAGYRRALAEYKLDYNPDYTYTVPLLTTDRYHPVLRVLEEHPECTAVITFSDMLSLKVMYCVNRFFPEKKVEVASFDNIQGSFPVNIDLTTVGPVQNGQNTATGCSQLLSELIQHPTTKTTHIVIKTKTITTK